MGGFKLNDLISVIVPVYNVEKYLRQCLNSINSQSYSNIEVIMVDDGSTDSSGSICDEYQRKYDNFSVIHKKNEGLGKARNTGLEYMKGNYVTFVDSDDYIEKEYIENLYRHCIEYHVDMCKGGFKRVIDSGSVDSLRKYNFELFSREESKFALLPRMIGSSPTQHDSIEMCVCGSMYNTELIKKYNVIFPSERELISEDLVFNIDYLQNVSGACIIENTDYNYRINLSSLTTSYRPDRFEACKHFYVEMKNKLHKLGYNKETQLRLDRMFFIYLKMCIEQEVFSNSRKSSEKNHKLSEICNDKLVEEVIREYPVKLLESKQRLFLYLIDKKLVFLLNFLMRLR